MAKPAKTSLDDQWKDKIDQWKDKIACLFQAGRPAKNASFGKCSLLQEHT